MFGGAKGCQLNRNKLGQNAVRIPDVLSEPLKVTRRKEDRAGSGPGELSHTPISPVGSALKCFKQVLWRDGIDNCLKWYICLEKLSLVFLLTKNNAEGNVVKITRKPSLLFLQENLSSQLKQLFQSVCTPPKKKQQHKTTNSDWVLKIMQQENQEEHFTKRVEGGSKSRNYYHLSAISCNG